MRKLLIVALIGLLAGVAYGAMTNSLDRRPTSYYWTGNLPKDIALLWGREVEGILEGTNAIDNKLIF